MPDNDFVHSFHASQLFLWVYNLSAERSSFPATSASDRSLMFPKEVNALSNHYLHPHILRSCAQEGCSYSARVILYLNLPEWSLSSSPGGHPRQNALLDLDLPDVWLDKHEALFMMLVLTVLAFHFVPFFIKHRAASRPVAAKCFPFNILCTIRPKRTI